MNVVLDDAEEVYVKDTKSKKTGDRQRLGASRSLSPLPRSLPRRVRAADRDGILDRARRPATAQGREHHAHQPDAQGGRGMSGRASRERAGRARAEPSRGEARRASLRRRAAGVEAKTCTSCASRSSRAGKLCEQESEARRCEGLGRERDCARASPRRPTSSSLCCDEGELCSFSAAQSRLRRASDLAQSSPPCSPRASKRASSRTCTGSRRPRLRRRQGERTPTDAAIS